MHYKRHYVQFNDLVFDGAEIISEDAPSYSFKSWSTEYGFKHGSYSPKKTRYGLSEATNVSMTIVLRYKSIPCEYRPFYFQFVEMELSKSGKLWAVHDGRLEWAYASISSMSEADSKKDTLEIDIDFELPEGVWHKADKQRTFLVPFDRCDFMECYEFREIRPCVGTNGDCCNCNTESKFCDCCDDCHSLNKDMALCYHEDDIQKFYECNGAGYRIVYDCDAAERFFGDLTNYIGQKFCTECGGTIAGVLYSDTNIETSGTKIRIHGEVKNPYIEINGNGNWIEGEYENLVINSDGSVYEDNGCIDCDPISVEKWKIPDGMTYGWTIHPGNNTFILETGNCCGTVCAYVEIDALSR